MQRTYSAIALVSVFALGCDAVRLADTVDLDFDFNLLTGPSDRLHSPYVAGADFDVYSVGVDEDEEIGWTIATSDPSVVDVIEPVGDGAASVSAVGPGTVDLIVNDELGEEMHRATVEVVQPDRADLVAHGPLLVRRPELQPASTDELRVLVGGSGTFLVEWFADGDPLMGHGALTAETGPGVVAQPRRTYLFEDREWLTLSAIEPGSHEVRLLANGVLTRTITVLGVDESAIEEVRLHGMDETEAERGDVLVVYAQAYATDGTPIYGVEYTWDLDGTPEEGLGDLFRYEFVPGVIADVSAHHGEMDAVATIMAEDGFVDSTNRLGCTVGWGESSPIGFCALALALFLVRRRRR